MNIEELRLEAGETAGDDLEPFANGILRGILRHADEQRRDEIGEAVLLRKGLLR
jgi:hypothetical protein